MGGKLSTAFTVARHAANTQRRTQMNPSKHAPGETSAQASYSKPVTCMIIERQRTTGMLQSWVSGGMPSAASGTTTTLIFKRHNFSLTINMKLKSIDITINIVSCGF